MGSGAVMDPAVGKELDLTDEQKDKLHEMLVRRESRAKAAAKVAAEGRGEASEGEAAKAVGFRDAREDGKGSMAVLTSDNRRSWKRSRARRSKSICRSFAARRPRRRTRSRSSVANRTRQVELVVIAIEFERN